jgi:short-subunit dehydrogenase
MSLFTKKSCYIIVGASKGLGKSIAVNFAKKANNESVFLLLSRNTQLLEVVKSEINTSCPQLKVVTQQFDQGELDEMKFANVFETAFSQNNLSKDNFQQAVIVQNAATVGILGDISKFTRDMSNVDQLKTYFDMNLTGTILLNTSFLKFFTQDKCPARYVVNMTSLAATRPIKSLSLYSTGEILFIVKPSLWHCLRYQVKSAPGHCGHDLTR